LLALIGQQYSVNLFRYCVLEHQTAWVTSLSASSKWSCSYCYLTLLTQAPPSLPILQHLHWLPVDVYVIFKITAFGIYSSYWLFPTVPCWPTVINPLAICASSTLAILFFVSLVSPAFEQGRFYVGAGGGTGPPKCWPGPPNILVPKAKKRIVKI